MYSSKNRRRIWEMKNAPQAGNLSIDAFHIPFVGSTLLVEIPGATEYFLGSLAMAATGAVKLDALRSGLSVLGLKYR